MDGKIGNIFTAGSRVLLIGKAGNQACQATADYNKQ